MSRRISANQLNIPLNPPSGGKLMMLRKNQQPITMGGLTITIIGPTAAISKKLQEEWNTWLRSANRPGAAQEMQDAARRDEERLGASEFDGLMASLRLQAESFGDPGEVTHAEPGLIDAAGRGRLESLLLTGDARGDQIVDGLRQAGRLNGGTSRSTC